jgi:hypothetical protein
VISDSSSHELLRRASALIGGMMQRHVRNEENPSCFTAAPRPSASARGPGGWQGAFHRDWMLASGTNGTLVIAGAGAIITPTPVNEANQKGRTFGGPAYSPAPESPLSASPPFNAEGLILAIGLSSG